MDPNQQPPRPNQRTPYISDFVAKPRADFVPPSRPQPQPPAPSQPALSPPQQPVSPLPTPPATPQQPPQQQRVSFEPPHAAEVSPRIPKTTKSHQGLRDVLSIFGVLASALVLAFCLITFVFQSYQVDGPSMQTTLQNNDHLIVWKVPKTISNLTGRHYIPNRGDVIVFNEPTADTTGSGKQLIKRIIGLPGERVVIKNNAITVYNQDFPNGFNPDKTLPYGKAITTTPGNVDVTIDDDEVYVVGDNRTNSLDSRVFGPIQSKQIVGKLVLRVLPLNTVTKF